jgi:dihydropteroate synthase
MAKPYLWKLKHRELVLGERTFVMGVLNLTPDSFSDGGKYADPDRAFARALELEDEGADIIDVGAESTRPGSSRISEAEELRRLMPVLKRLKGRLGVPISVDTYKSGVADKALEHGVEIINDPSGAAFDPQLPKIVSKWDAGLVLNHMRGTPETWAKLPPLKDVMRTIASDLEAAVHRVQRMGVQKHQIVVDPGIGFGKRREQNAEIISRLGELRFLDLPILIGPSRKSFLKQQSSSQTEFATAGAVAACLIHGAHIVRVHDAKNMKALIEVVDQIRRSGETD